MPRRALRLRSRLAAVLAGAAAALLTGGVARADIPPLPGVPDVPNPSITWVIGNVGLSAATVPPPQNGCVIFSNYDNTQAAPPGTLFRGQSACGSGVYAPQLTGQTRLVDIFSQVVSTGSSYAQTGGIGTSQGNYLVQPAGPLPTTAGPVPLPGGGPVPGLSYTIIYTATITLTYPQTWTGPQATGCSANGQTLNCVTSTTYDYIPGTQGGLTPG